MNKLIIGLICFLTTPVSAVDPKWSDDKWNNFLTALREVETGGHKNEGRGIKGDGGKALGPYQIHKCYWVDAVGYDKSLSAHKYDECLNDKELSERVVKAYIKSYLPQGGTVEEAARIHNGSINQFRKKATAGYGIKFMRVWKKITSTKR